LPDQLLAATTGTTIVIDADAAGWGWFVDATPLGNSEFRISLGNGVFAAAEGSPAYGRMDLLTTLLHELGNAMGFAEDNGEDVTGMTLAAGVRRVFGPGGLVTADPTDGPNVASEGSNVAPEGSNVASDGSDDTPSIAQAVQHASISVGNAEPINGAGLVP